MNDVRIPLEVDVGGDVTLAAQSGGAVNVGMDTTITAAIMPHYDGPVRVTPGPTPQTLSTTGKVMDEDITIGAIPSNYGLITWNGSFLTVT